MIWLNGTVREAEGAFSANDRGLLLGEAVFETMSVDATGPQFWAAHMARLEHACAAFGFARRFDADALRAGLDALRAAQKSDAEPKRQILRVTVTGGDGGRGLVPQTPSPSNWLMQLSSAPAQADYIRLCDSADGVLAGSASAAHKTTAYLDNILARRAALKADADEALLFNQYGRLAGAAAGNLFVQKGKQLITPPVSEGALPGIIRHVLLSADLPDGLRAVEGLVGRDLLAKADALYLTNSVHMVVAAGYDADCDTAQKQQGRTLSAALLKSSAF